MAERWYKLLSNWQDKQLRHSLTFPFLIGALRVPIGAVDGHADTGLKEVEELIDAIRLYKAVGHVFHVYPCGDRNKLVITRVNGKTGPWGAAAIPPDERGRSAVLFASPPGSSKANTTVESLVSAIWTEGGAAIDQGLFSCRGTQFQPFDKIELRFIQSALA